MSLQTAVTQKPFLASPLLKDSLEAANAFDVYVLGSATRDGFRPAEVSLYHVDPTGMWFRSALRPFEGEVLGFSLRGFKDFVARVISVEEDGFVVVPASEMEIESLVAEVAAAPRGEASHRRHERVTPKNLRAVLRMGSDTVDVDVIDISVSGAAVATLLRPPMGASVKLGGMAGKVVRHLSNGFAIEFDDMLGQVSAEMRSLS